MRLRIDLGLGLRAISQSLDVSPSVVHERISRFQANAIPWPIPPEMDDAELENKLYPAPSSPSTSRPFVDLDYDYIHRELARKHVTKRLLWQEYKLANGELAYQYSRFCELVTASRKTLHPSMHFERKAGERVFVDWSGDGIWIVDAQTGSKTECPLFVATIGVSGYAFAKAAPNRQSEQWLSMHIEMLEFFGAVPTIVVPDNEKTGVSRACRYDPEINPSYAAWAKHYHTVILPTRPRKPKDKALVECGVLDVQRSLLAPLRNHTFFNLHDANHALASQLEQFNQRPLQRSNRSRKELFVEVDLPAMNALPNARFEPFSSAIAKVNIDFHIIVDKHHYSVPYELIGKRVDVHYTSATVEVFYGNSRVASHPRGQKLWGWTTLDAHRPPSHHAYLEWTPERLHEWARKTGPKTAELVATLITAQEHPERGYRASLGILRLGQRHGAIALEAACEKAIFLGSPRYRTVKTILANMPTGADASAEGLKRSSTPRLPVHGNVRGASYYH